MRNVSTPLSRREMLRLALVASATGVSMGGARRAWAQGAEPPELRQVDASDRKLLFVVCAYGGASIIDSFLPVLDYEVPDPFAAMELNVFPGWGVEQLPGSAFRTPTLLGGYGIYAKPNYVLSDFVRSHGEDLAVIAHGVSSVNHTVGQQRSLNGAGVDRGRTLMESMALRYGGGLPLPSCNMASDGYLRHGADSSVPQRAQHELISSPLLFAAGTHGSRGVAGAPEDAIVARARAVRDSLEQSSLFGRTFANDPRRRSFLRTRKATSQNLESENLFDKLLLMAPGQGNTNSHPGTLHPVASEVRALFPNLEVDPVEAQVALGFLLAYHGVSTSVTVGLETDPYVTPEGDITGAPIAFDFSHNSHREVQSLMWSRTMSAVDKLIGMLKSYDYMGDPSLGKMWDRSLVYVATEFGRSKKRPALSGSWGTGHDLNNGSLIISPLVRGNAVYGGVDPGTCHTYGFDPSTGEPAPDVEMGESDVYGIIAHALDLDAPSAGRFPAVVRG